MKAFSLPVVLRFYMSLLASGLAIPGIQTYHLKEDDAFQTERNVLPPSVLGNRLFNGGENCNNMVAGASSSSEFNIYKRQPGDTETAMNVSHSHESDAVDSKLTDTAAIVKTKSEILPSILPQKSGLFNIIERANLKKALALKSKGNTVEISEGIAETSFIAPSWEVRELMNSATIFHRELRSFVGTEGFDSHRFREYHPILSEELPEVGFKITILEYSDNLSLKRVRDYYNNIIMVFQLMEMACGLRLELSSLSSPRSGEALHQEAKATLNTSKPLSSETSTETIGELNIYLKSLIASQEALPDEHSRMGEPQGNSNQAKHQKQVISPNKSAYIGAPVSYEYSKITEEDLKKVEKKLEFINGPSRLSCQVSKPKEIQGSLNSEIPSENDSFHQFNLHKEQQIRQRFAVHFLKDRLHFVRDSLQECTNSVCLGFSLYDEVSDKLRNICMEVEEQLEKTQFIDWESKRLLYHLLKATKYRWDNRRKLFTASLGDSAHVDDSEPNLRESAYTLKEADVVKAELGFISARLKKLQYSSSSLNPETLANIFSISREQVREKGVFLQDKYWYWTSRGSVVKLMEAEICSMLKTVQIFIMDQRIYKKCYR